MADGCFLCSCRIFRASIARRYKSKVLETSSCCCSAAGSCDLILFLIFFFFFFFTPCAGWRNTKFQTSHLVRMPLSPNQPRGLLLADPQSSG